jgi:hypothetical protein
MLPVCDVDVAVRIYAPDVHEKSAWTVLVFVGERGSRSVRSGEGSLGFLDSWLTTCLTTSTCRRRSPQLSTQHQMASPRARKDEIRK